MQILILDDQPGLADTLALSLRMAGYSACGFTQPQKALAALQPEDTLVTDYHMPEMTGLEVARQAYSQGWRGPLFLMSGNARLIKEPLDHPLLQLVLNKPFSTKTLIKAITPKCEVWVSEP